MKNRQISSLSAKWETHAHTNLVSPCSHISPQMLAENYLAEHYTGVMVTDHYGEYSLGHLSAKPWRVQADFLLSGYRAVAAYGGKKGLRVALGFEITFDASPNDFLVFGMTEAEVIANARLHTMSRRSFHELARDCGWLVYQAHPYRYGLAPENPEWLDGIEVRNTHPGHQSFNERALSFARSHGLWMSCGSDTHYSGRPMGGILLDADVHDAQSMVRCIRAHQGDIALIDQDDTEYMIGG